MLIIPILVFFTEQEVVVRGDRVGWQETHQGSQVAHHSPGPKQQTKKNTVCVLDMCGLCLVVPLCPSSTLKSLVIIIMSLPALSRSLECASGLRPVFSAGGGGGGGL